MCDNLRATLFADDAAFYFKGTSINEVVFNVDCFIKILSRWLILNKLTPNVNKTKLMIFTPCYVGYLPPVNFNNAILDWVDSFKYLGVIINKNLNFKDHVNFLCSKLSKVQGIIYAASPYFNRKCLVSIFYSLGYSILIQSIIIYGRTFTTILNPLRILLNNICRVILNVKRDYRNIPLLSTNEMYYKLNFLKFDDIYNYFLTKFLHRVLYKDDKLYNEYFSQHVPDHRYQIRNKKFNLPPIRVEVERNFTIFRAIELYNSLPDTLKVPLSDTRLKKSFKKYVLDTYRD